MSAILNIVMLTIYLFNNQMIHKVKINHGIHIAHMNQSSGTQVLTYYSPFSGIILIFRTQV